jgi:hypothetical protein
MESKGREMDPAGSGQSVVLRARTHGVWRGRRALERADRVAMRSTWFVRSVPDVFIIGAQKAGSTALFRYLMQHPNVEGCKRKEAHYFDFNFSRGERWYRGQFPLKAGLRRGSPELHAIVDATPGYLFDPRTPSRLHAFAPQARLLVVLRDPVERAFSHYHHVRAMGVETLDFEEALEREESRFSGEHSRFLADDAYASPERGMFAYARRGMYLDQLNMWLSTFPRERLLVLITEEMSARPAATVLQAQRFLGLTPYEAPSYQRVNSRSYAEIDRHVRQRLAQRFEEPNERLYELLGRKLGWTRPDGTSLPT